MACSSLCTVGVAYFCLHRRLPLCSIHTFAHCFDCAKYDTLIEMQTEEEEMGERGGVEWAT